MRRQRTTPVNPMTLNLSGLTERAACRRLAALAQDVSAAHAIVELGAYRGRTAAWLAWGASRGLNAHVTSIDPWEQVTTDGLDDHYTSVEPQYVDGRYASAFDEFRSVLDCAQLWGRVTPLRATALDAARLWRAPIGLLFHDAGHTADHVEADLAAWAPFVVPGGWIACHDLGRVDESYGVEEGAARVLDNDEWDWASRERLLWEKDPKRRGLLVVRRRS